MRIRHWLSSIALGLIFVLAACDRVAEKTETLPRPIDWVAVEPFDGTAVRSLSGILRSIQRASLSFEVPGLVQSVPVDVGDTFVLGDVLGQLETRTFDLEVNARAGELAEAQARLVEARNNFVRQEQLFADGWVSRSAFDAAQAALQAAESAVSAAEARLAIARENLANATLRAPYDGVIADRMVEPSQQVQAGQTVFEIQGPAGGLEVVVSVPETLVDFLENGSAHGVTLPSRPDLMLDGVISEIASEPSSRNAFPVTLVLRDPPEDLRPGTTAEVAFRLQTISDSGAEPSLLAIPLTAFLAGEDDVSFAFVYDPETQTVRRRPITIEDLTSDRALVSDGLESGEIIAAKGVAFLRDGQAVRLLGEGPDQFNQ